jgi:hypothetical protein
MIKFLRLFRQVDIGSVNSAERRQSSMQKKWPRRIFDIRRLSGSMRVNELVIECTVRLRFFPHLVSPWQKLREDRIRFEKCARSIPSDTKNPLVTAVGGRMLRLVRAVASE